MDRQGDGSIMRWELHLQDEDYPQSVKQMEEPPEVLYGRGDVTSLSGMCLAVIGARKATPYGLAVASMAGRIAAESGITLVSGGAMGCDAAAARGALDAGGKTIVVAGVGADCVYPRSSADVYARAPVQGGAVISLAPWGTEPQRWAFLKRNTIIAALSRAVVVSEAGARSGTTSTAMAAISLGREVYAVPGSIFSPESLGANNLIRDGANIIASESDLEMLISRDFGVLRLVREEIATPRGRVLSALVASPMRADDLANHLGMQPLEMLRILSDYEVAGAVVRLPDGRYAPTEQTLLGTR
ncbi:MAG: DNA-processing protein DprA [Atopobiaceae bacterium]|nr:DNA-processing protein DprA [Atopobiaceae bacterium]